MNLAQRLKQEVDTRKPRVLVVGDTMTDVWVHGRVEECQDGCPKFIEEERHTCLGGAANARRCITAWGIKAPLFGLFERDQPTKCRFVDQHGKIAFRYDCETPLTPVRCTEYTWVRQDALDAISTCQAVLLSDYDKGLLTPRFMSHVGDLCQSRGIPLVVDAKRGPDVYPSTAIIKGNGQYFNRWGHRARRKDSQAVTTYGDSPPIVCNRGAPSTHHRTWLGREHVKCVNHVGAGDCFAGVLTLALACGLTLEEAATVAHSAGRVYVQHPHNRPPTPSEVAEDMEPPEPHGRTSRIGPSVSISLDDPPPG